MDIKATVDNIVKKIQSDPALLMSFKNDPIPTLEKLSGIDLPDEQLKPVVAAVQAKLAAGSLNDLFKK